jgi:osmoprotectant transport system ATP-binding protein
VHDGAGTLRGALDAALSSPARCGVAVDAEGRYRGGVAADDVLALLDRGNGRDPAR